MRWLPDSTVDHLREVAEWPDLGATKYEIVGRIGRGGMATVYLARDRELGREVAVKVPHGADAAPAESARLLQEARILASLEHPGIVPVHDVGTLPDGRVFYVMKRVQGTRLDEHARMTPSLAERLRLFLRIGEAVGFAHAHGVIHRDLKPENVMMGPFGEVLVLDWGVARVRGVPTLPAATPSTLPAGPSATAPGTVLGTPGYMAPEQAVGDLDLIDARTDVYALGGILYFLLTGRPPLATGAGASEAALARQPPRRWVPSLPRPLEAICLKALSDQPADRYPTVERLAADVARFLERLPVEAYREGVLERTVRVATKYQAAIVLVVAYLVMRVVLLLLGGP